MVETFKDTILLNTPKKEYYYGKIWIYLRLV